MMEPADLVSEPELVTLPTGYKVWEARAETHAGRPLKAIMLPPWVGASLPWHQGDRVMLIVYAGTGYVVGAFVTATDHGGNTDLAPRGSGDVRVGSGTGAWEPLMLFGRLSDEVVNLKAQIDALAQYVATMTATAGPTIIGAGAPGAVAGAATIGPITGGDPAARVKGRKA